MKITVIVNPHAGRQQILKETGALRRIFSEGYDTVDIVETADPDDARETVLRVVAEGTDCLVCCGGDGTLSDTVGWMLSSGHRVELGYIPAGTTNDFAASLHLPKDPLEAARHILSHPAAPLDVGAFGDRTFIYTASFGAFTGSSYNTDPALKHTLGHLAYVLEGIRELPTVQPYRVRVETVEGRVFEDDFIFGSMTNSTSLGGVVKLDPAQVDLTDGLFELLLVKAPRNLAEFNAMVYALTRGKYDDSAIQFVHTAGATFTFPEPVDWSLDGEYAVGETTMRAQVLPQAIQLHY